jgi:predicted nucleic acid-binding protein
MFLSYINGIEERVESIEDLWKEISESDDKGIVASAIGIAEVACLDTEKSQNRANPRVEADIDAMWHDPSVSLIEVSPHIAFLARKLMRDGISEGWALKPYDAVHLATAMWVHRNVGLVSEFHTYDDGLKRYTSVIGIAICEPHVRQPKLL